MDNVTPYNQVKPDNNPMPVPAENNPVTDASPTTWTETPVATETPAPLETLTTETLANESSAPFCPGWVAYILRIASAPGRWAFKKIKTLFTFGTLWKMYIVYQVVTAATGFFFPSRNSSSMCGDASIQHPPVVQHFMFEPVGYSYACSSHQISLSTTGTPPHRSSSLGGSVRGYYEKDAKALREAIRVVPVYSNLPKIPPCAADDAPNVTDENLRTCSVTFPEEGNEAAAETCLPDEDLEGSTGNSTTNETTQNFNATQEKKTHAVSLGTVIVFDIRHGHDIETSFVREAVTFLLGQMRDREFYAREWNDNATCIFKTEPRRFEVVVILESNGGSVSKYGLLAEQLRRLRNEPGVILTVCCDESALSGGYMLAALASPGQLLAAPFASVGSIGVISSEILNFQHVLERLGVQSFRFQGGEAKADISWLGEVGEDQMKRTQDNIDAVHEAFREHVRVLRGDLIQDFDAITDGNHWIGTSALKLGLVDRLITSDEYIDERVRAGDRVLKLLKCNKEGWAKGWGKWLGASSDMKLQGSSWISILGSETVDEEMSIAQRSLLEIFEILYIGMMMVVAKVVGRI